MQILFKKTYNSLLKNPDADGILAFLDLNISINDERQIKCRLYQKSTDTGIILNFLSYAPLQHKKR